MKAETAYNVIQALTPSELTRLYKLLGIETFNKTKKQKKDDGLPTVTQAMEDLILTEFA